MMRLRTRLAAMLCTSCLSVNAQNHEVVPDTCESLDACVERIFEIAKSRPLPSSGFGRYEHDLIARFLELGEDAVPVLVDMLADEDENVAHIASTVLSRVPRIDAQFLKPILQGLDRGLGWLNRALGRIDSDDATKAAIDRLLRSDSSGSGNSYAVSLQGRRAIPMILEAARCEGGCDSRDHMHLGTALKDMGPARAEAGPGLLAIVEQAVDDRELARKVLNMIRDLGSDGLALEADLLALRARRPELTVYINAVLIDIGSQAAINVFVEHLRHWDSPDAFFGLAKTGAAGWSAGPVVVDHLDSEDWDTRLRAASTLGFLRYEPAVDDLTRLLDLDEDVLLNWIAADSLGRIGDLSAGPALRRTAESHWHPSVREVASVGIARLEGELQDPFEAQLDDDDFGRLYSAHRQMGRDLPACKKFAVSPRLEPEDTKLYRDISDEQLLELAYLKQYTKSVIDRDATEIPEGAYHSWIEVEMEEQAVPVVALRINSGWLLGHNRGEWGGELMFAGEDGETSLILHENIVDLHWLDGRIVAVAGIAHLSSNHGMVYLVERSANGEWSARQWRRLPGTPQRAWPVSTGEVLIDTLGGNILLSGTGSLRMAPCSIYATPQNEW